MGCTKEEKARRGYIRSEVQRACKDSYGWVKTPSKLKGLISEATFKRYKALVRQAPGFDGQVLLFALGAPTDAPLAALVQVGRPVIATPSALA